MKKLAVIKAESVARPEALGLRCFHFNDVAREARDLAAVARRQAEALTAAAQADADAARREARAMRAAAQQEVDGIREAARQAGFKAGYAEGFKQGSEEGRAVALAAAQREFAASQAQLTAAFRAGIESIEHGQAEWQAVARRDLAELALAIARRVVRHVGERDREVVLANLEEAVRLVGARSDVTIAVHPADAEAARVFAQSLLDLKESWEHVRVVEESEVSRGGCRIQWGSGSVDATLETQLDRIAAELKGE